MADEYRAEQGTVVPTMFIGLGGTGSRIVNRIALRASRLPNWKSQLEPLTSFVAVDTNQFDLDRLDQLPAGNRLQIGGFDKPTIIQNFRDDRNPQALQWLPAAYQPRRANTPGAGQIRLEARLDFFYRSPEIRARLREVVRRSLVPNITWRRAMPADYHVYLFCTLAGGTGSGSFLPMAYLIRDVVEEEGTWHPRVIGNLLLSTMILDRVGKDLHPDVHANVYAALKELEHLTKLNYQQVRVEGRTAEPFVYRWDRAATGISTVHSAPFFLNVIYDKSNLTVVDPEAAVADTAYLQIFTPNIGNMTSALDNYEKRLGELTRFPGDLRDVGQGYAKNYGVVGAAALVVPADDLLEYCALRFAAEAVRSQITFGVGLDDAADDRARALARHAVNYDDPKFLRMGDEGRDQVVNQAFMESVREMARQDERQDLRDGFWYQLVERVDSGPVTGANDKGEAQRGESLQGRVKRRLEEQRREVIGRVAIRDRAFVFHKEGVNQYVELLSRLREEIRGARQAVGEGTRGLASAAAEGEVMADLRLDPITERYLVLRLFDECAQKWIPEAEEQHRAARARDISDAKVSDRLDELYKELQEVASRRSLPFRRGDDAFLGKRDEAQEYYRSVAVAARKFFEAEAALTQLRALHDYLRKRARQYAGLARHLNGLVADLEADAEELRRGRGGADPRLALSVEVFETLDEPRARLWPRVYRALFLDEGRYLSTFDRGALAACIADQLKPTVRADGMTVEKTEDQTLRDLRNALIALGRERLRPAIFGEGTDPGLDVARGLELEAALVLGGGRRAQQGPSREEIDAYVARKFRALAQISGVLARTSTGEWVARNDGVVVDRTRYIVHGFGQDGVRAPRGFLDRLRATLTADEQDRAINLDSWHDPRILIVYDIEMPIPLYYIRPVIDEVENAYLLVQSDEKRGYNLHIDFNWEEVLPNLNPRKAEIAVGWSLRMLATGLVAGVVEHQPSGEWLWQMDEGPAQRLGVTLSGALYQIGDLHRRSDFETLRRMLEARINGALGAMSADDRRARRDAQAAHLEKTLFDIERRKLNAAMRPQDALERPILRALFRLVQADGADAA